MMFNKKARDWDITAAICISLIVFLSGYALELTYWTYDLNRVTSLALLGLFTGFVIGRSSFSILTSRLLMILYGLAFFVLQFIIPLNHDPSWLARVNQYFERVSFSFSQLSRNIPLEDGILFLTAAGALFLIIGLILGFRLMRSRPLWIPFFFICTFFLLTQFYLPDFARKYFFIAVFTFLVIFFIGRQTYFDKRLGWERSRIKIDAEISRYFSRSLLLITFILGSVSWGVPAIINTIYQRSLEGSQVRQQRSSDSWEMIRNFFYPLKQQTGFGEGYFPDILALGTSRSQKDDEVFTVTVAGDLSYPGRFYWKGRIYDTYENGTWKNSYTELSDTKSFDFTSQPLYGFEPAEFTLHYLYPREVVFTPQFVLGIDRKSSLLIDPINEEQSELVSIVDYGLVRTGDTVQVIGGYNSISLQALKDEKGAYPSWVVERDLQLPDNLPGDIPHLAEDLTRDKTTNIEKALEIINYLRNSFQYKNTVYIPQGEEPIAWFLFSGHEGYCNYFSTSAALMLRSIGIPARYVVGYAQGERIDGSNAFDVRIADSHSWVEAYFRGYGWVILEATPSQPSVEFPQQASVPENIDRREAFILQPPGENQNSADIEEFSQLSEKYAEEISPAEANDPVLKNFLVGFLIIISLGGVITAAVYLAIFRQGSIRVPVIIEHTYRKKKNVPKWIQNWANFEEKSATEKNYLRLMRFSRYILKDDPRLLTPHEFFDELFKQINYPNPDEFAKSYQEIFYAPVVSDKVLIESKEYQVIIKSIFHTWFKMTSKYWKYRLGLGRLGTMSLPDDEYQSRI